MDETIVVEVVHRSPDLARVKPLIVTSDGGSVPADPEDYPDVGLVFWWHPPSEAEKETYWHVRVEPSRNYSPELHQDSNSVVAESEFKPIPVVQVVRSQELGLTTLTELRRMLASGRLQSSTVLLNRVSISIPESENLYTEFINLHEGANDEFSFSITSGSLGAVDLGSGTVHSITIHGNDIEIVYPQHYHHKNRIVTLDDTHLIASLLRRIRHFDRNVAEALSVTRNVLDEYVQVLDRSLVGPDIDHEEARKLAAEALIGDLEARGQYLDEVVSALLATEAVKSSLEQEIDALKLQRLDQIERQIAEEISEQEDTINNLRHEKSGLEVELASLEERFSSLIEEIVDESKKSLLRDKLFSRINPQVITKDYSDLAAGGPAPLSDFDEWLPEITATSSKYGIDPITFRMAVAALYAQSFCFVSGKQAIKIGRALGMVISGRLAVGVSISSTVFSFDDLLNRPIYSISGASMPSITLGSFLLEAGKIDQVVTVILEGINRTPFETFAAELNSLTQPNQSLAWRTTQNEIKSLVTCGNTCFVALLVDGPSSFSLATEFIDNLPLINADYLFLPEESVLTKTDANCTLRPVSTELWKKEAAMDGIEDEISQLGAKRELKRFLARFSSIYKTKDSVITALALTNYSVVSEETLGERGLRPEVEKFLRANASLITRFTMDD
jgi:hypothetical protein